MMTKFTKTILSAAMLCCVAGQAHAAWPERAITMIVPFAAGGSTDATARMVAEKLGTELGTQVVVENRPGAGSNIGAAAAARSTPDGYTLLLASSTIATNATLYKNPGFDLRKDLIPVSQIALIPNVLVVNNDVPAKDLKSFVAHVKNDKNHVYYGSAGSGSSQHLSGALFNTMVNGTMTHVPYKGGAPANMDLLAGQIQAVFSPLSEVLPHIDAGKLRALGVTTKDRSTRLPNVPAIGEELPGFEIALWNAIFVPTGTPQEIVDKLGSAVGKVTEDPDFRKTLAEQGIVPVGSTPSEFKTYLASEIEKWGKLVEISGAKVD